MLAEDSVSDSSIYFDESHQMSSQLELCMSLAKKQGARARNLFRVMSATIDPKEFLSFLGISKLYTLSGRRYPVKLEVELAKDVDEMSENPVALPLPAAPRRIVAGLPPHEAPRREVRRQLRGRLHSRRSGGV